MLRGLGARGATLSNPPEWLITALTGSGSTFAGKPVTVRTTLGLVPYWRGVNILSNAFRQSPCKIYRERDGQREQVRAGRAYELLHNQANEPLQLASDEYWAIVESHIESWGNSFTWKEYGADGRVANLWPINPARVRVGVVKNQRVFVIDGRESEPFTDRDILHIRGLSLDGVVGYSPVQLAKEEIANQLSRQEFKGRFWANDATPGVTLIHPNKLQPDAVDRLRALWDDRHKGPRRGRATAVLGEDIKVQQMTMPLADAQFIEQERYGRTEIALMLGLPAYMLAGDSGGDSLTYSTTEGHSLDLLKWTIGPRFVAVQNGVSLDQDLMPSNHYARFEDGAILRATTTERYKAWAVAPHLTIDEMREMDDRPPLPDGAGQVLAKSVSAPQVGPDSGESGDSVDRTIHLHNNIDTHTDIAEGAIQVDAPTPVAIDARTTIEPGAIHSDVQPPIVHVEPTEVTVHVESTGYGDPTEPDERQDGDTESD